MSVSAMRADHPRFLSRWLLATTGGWFLGIILVVLLAVLGGMLDVEVQLVIGLGVGLAVGFAQWRVAREWFGATSAWVWSTAAGLTLPFLICDILRVEVKGDAFIPLAAAAGLLVGAWQRHMLPRHVVHPSWWILASVVGWSAAIALFVRLTSTQYSALVSGTFLSLAAIPLAGLTLGILTGVALERMLGTPTPVDVTIQKA